LTIPTCLPGFLRTKKIRTTKWKFHTFANTDGLINCLRQPGQLHYQHPKSMVLNIFQLIKSCCIWTDPATETESIGLPAYAQLSAFLQSHQDSFILTRDSQPSTGIRPSTRITPSGSFAWTKKLSSVNRDYPISTALSGQRNFQPSTGTFHLDQKFSSVYRDCAKTHSSACRRRQLN
jgi:hypothetical protein